MRDYARVYGVRTVVLRQSCIYGHRQFGIEDQGWLAWLAGAALRGQPITVFGDGKQVRDVLDVEDLLDAYEAAVERIDRVAGEVFNIGGGPENTLSVWAELGPMLERAVHRSLSVTYRPWRVGDQRVYISDVRKAQRVLDWHPRVGVEDGLSRLLEWSRSEE